MPIACRGVLVLVLMAPVCAEAGTTICQFSDATLWGPKVLSWDDTTKRAKVQMGDDEAVSGTLTSKRPHDKGWKVNLVFRGTELLYRDELEFAVFSIDGDKKFGAIGVGYKLVDGVKHLDRFIGKLEPTCSSLD